MTIRLAAAIAVLALPARPAAASDPDAGMPFFVGRDACLECHAPGRAADACPLEPIPAHARSFDALSRPEAAHVAALNGVTEAPGRSRICLGCHATAADAGPRWTAETFRLADGVQCEACHGAGSLHAEGHRDRRGVDPLDVSRRMGAGDRSACADCHRPRPSHRAVLEEGYRRPEADALYKSPENLAISPDGGLVYVVCAQSDSLAVVDARSGRVVDEIPVGRRPHDVALSPGGRTLYVTNRLGDSLSVVDAQTRTVVAEVAVGDDPHGVVTDGSGRLVFVLDTAQDTVTVVDAVELKVVSRVAAGAGPWSAALRPDGRTVWMTNVRPQPVGFREPPRSEVTVMAADRGVLDRPGVAEANMLGGIAGVPGRDVAIFTLLRTKNLVPITRLAQGWTITNGLGVLWPDGRVDQVLLDEPNASFPDPMDVAVSPDGRHALVTSGGADLVAVVDVDELLSTLREATDSRRREVLPNHLGTARRFVVKRIEVGANPRGVIFSPDGRRAYVANALDDTLTVIETSGFTPAGTIDLGGPGEVTETRWGERLFHSAAITFGRQFSCRSCHPDGHINGLTFDIEPDGLGMNPVDNRTLRGIFDTAPFKWEGTNPTLRRQCGPRLAVFFTRLDPYTPAELTALVRYIATIERPPNRYRAADGLTPAQRRGQLLFQRTRNNRHELIPRERRCTTCHSGPMRSAATRGNVGTTMWFDVPVDTTVVDLGDLALDVERYGELGLYYFLDTGTPTRSWDAPHLTNIYDSAPYLHNGAAPSLEEIWTRFDVVRLHGAVDDLTRRQFNDLIAYLKSL